MIRRAASAARLADETSLVLKDTEKRERSVAAGGAAPLADRKSEAEAKAADKVHCPVI